MQVATQRSLATAEEGDSSEDTELGMSRQLIAERPALIPGCLYVCMYIIMVKDIADM